MVKTCTYKIRLTEEERSWFETAAQGCGKSLAAWMRDTLYKSLGDIELPEVKVKYRVRRTDGVRKGNKVYVPNLGKKY